MYPYVSAGVIIVIVAGKNFSSVDRPEALDKKLHLDYDRKNRAPDAFRSLRTERASGFESKFSASSANTTAICRVLEYGHSASDSLQ